MGCCVLDLTHSQVNAISTAMLTSDSILLKHYIKINPKAQYRQAQETLDTVLGKRRRDKSPDGPEDGQDG